MPAYNIMVYKGIPLKGALSFLEKLPGVEPVMHKVPGTQWTLIPFKGTEEDGLLTCARIVDFHAAEIQLALNVDIAEKPHDRVSAAKQIVRDDKRSLERAKYSLRYCDERKRNADKDLSDMKKRLAALRRDRRRIMKTM